MNVLFKYIKEENYEYPYCPQCNKIIPFYDEGCFFCSNCGTPLDWPIPPHKNNYYISDCRFLKRGRIEK